MSELFIVGGIVICLEEDLIFVLDSFYDCIIVLDGSGRVFDYVRCVFLYLCVKYIWFEFELMNWF